MVIEQSLSQPSSSFTLAWCGISWFEVCINSPSMFCFLFLDPAGSPDSPDGAMDSKSITALLTQGAGKICDL